MRDFRLNGGFANRKRVIFAEMVTCEDKTRVSRVKWGILEEKMCDFRINGGFAKRMRDFCLKNGFAKKKCDFRLNGGFVKRKRVIFRLNGGFSKRKRVIFA